MAVASPQQQAVWDLFAEDRTVTVADAETVGVALNTARMYFAEWKRIGAIAFSHAEGKTRFYVRAVDSTVPPRELRVGSPADDERSLRDRVWEVFRTKETVTVADLEEAGIFRKTAEGVLGHWREIGAIAFDRREGRRKYFRRVWDQAEAPAFVRADAKLAPRDRVARNLWTAARMLKSFTPRDLAAHAATSTATVEMDDAARFARMLMRGGYVRVLRKARPSEDIEARYRLVRDTGPKPPIEKRVRAVWDENEGRYAHVPEGTS